jgi:hypothetical protein
MSSPADQHGERILFEERTWVPWWTIALMFAFAEGAAIAIFLITKPNLTSALIGFAVATGSAAFWGTWFKLGARRVWNRVGERTLRFGRARPVPVEAVREVRPVTGRREVKRLKVRLRRGARFFGATWNPNLKGILAPPGTKTAVLVRVDPSASRTRIFLLGTHHPDELLAALGGERRTGGEPVDARADDVLAY